MIIKDSMIIVDPDESIIVVNRDDAEDKLLIKNSKHAGITYHYG